MRRLFGSTSGGTEKDAAVKGKEAPKVEAAKDTRPGSSSTGLLSRIRKSHSHSEPNRSGGGKHVVIQQQNSAELNGRLLNARPHSSSSFSRPGFHGGGFYSPSPSACSDRVDADGELDKSLMQTCTDVKYTMRRPPKFTAVVEANFQRQCLQAHNYVREVYGVPGLTWSNELAELARTWAVKLAVRGRILYPELSEVGENIHLITSNDTRILDAAHTHPPTVGSGETCTGDHLITGMELVALWASEAAHFDFSRPKWSIKCKNFTQLIWRSSVEMGVARNWNTTRDCLAVVALYRPGGNSNLTREITENIPSRDCLVGNHLEATSLGTMIRALNRTDLDGGFRKGPPAPRPIIHSPNQTKILK